MPLLRGLCDSLLQTEEYMGVLTEREEERTEKERAIVQAEKDQRRAHAASLAGAPPAGGGGKGEGGGAKAEAPVDSACSSCAPLSPDAARIPSNTPKKT